MFYILSYITGGLLVLLALLNFVFPQRKTTLLFKASTDFTTIINLVFVLLATNNYQVLTSVVLNCIATIRDVLYLNRNKIKFLDTKACPIVFASINAFSLIFTYKSPLSIVPTFGSVISSSTLFANNQKVCKFGAFTATSCYLIYYAILIPSSDVLTIFPLIASIAGLIGTGIGIYILFKNEKKAENKSIKN